MRFLSNAWLAIRTLAKYNVMKYSWWGAGPRSVLIPFTIDGFSVYLPPPGVCVVVLSIVAAYMAIRAEHKWSVGEKIVWMLLVCALSVLELRSIYKDRDEFELKRIMAETQEQQARDEEHRSFQKLIDSGHAIVKTEKNLANKTDAILTGGGSYIVVTPTPKNKGGNELVLFAAICPKC